MENNEWNDCVPVDAEESREIGFSIDENYNASSILFDNLQAGREDKIALMSDVGSYTYGELCVTANCFGNGLKAKGLKQGDRILLILDDSADYVIALFGAIKVGVVPVLVNTLSPADLVLYYANDAEAKAIFLHEEYASLVVDCSIPWQVTMDYEEGKAWLASHSDHLTSENTHRDDMAFWMYSSGSTGKPKGVVHLQHDMLYTAQSYASNVLDINENDVCFSVPKIFFAYGFGNTITFPFFVGATTSVLSGRPTPDVVFQHIEKFKPTLFFALPTVYTALIKHSAAQSANLESVRLCISAAEVLSSDVFEAWRSRFGHCIVEGLGSTEVLHIYLSNITDQQKPGSAGKRVPGYALKLTDIEGSMVAAGEDGILWVRGDSNAPCYWNKPEKTKETMRDGWIWTGDRFSVDSDGFYFFLGRADDLVKVSGQWVYPLEVEHCLNEHPDVFESTVLAVERPDRRMQLVAVIALIEKCSNENGAMVANLQDYVKQQLLPFKYPREIFFLESLPKTGTGKIDRQGCKKFVQQKLEY